MAAAKKARTTTAKRPAVTKAPSKKSSTKKSATTKDRVKETKARVEKTRVVIAMDVYEPNKDAIKKPFKENELKWNFLGEGKGLYKRADNGVHCFTQFKDDGVHYSIWGDDKPRVQAILATWRALLGAAGWAKATTSGEQATAQEKEAQETDAMRLWRLAKPQARPGEPEFFLKKRMAEWEAKRPA